jgi:hypothetical protein
MEGKMPVVKTRYACPTCDAQIIAENRKLVCSVNSQHSWNDIATFMGLGPKVKYEEAKPIVAPQANHVKVELTLPPRIRQGLEAKFGSTHSGKIAETLGFLADGDVMLIPAADLDRIKERLGKRPESSGELFGLIYNLSMELETEKLIAENSQKELAAWEGRSHGTVIVDLGKNFQAASEKARGENMPLKMWLEDRVKNALDNSWF